jgi:hypothetical protein
MNFRKRSPKWVKGGKKEMSFRREARNGLKEGSRR